MKIKHGGGTAGHRLARRTGGSSRRLLAVVSAAALVVLGVAARSAQAAYSPYPVPFSVPAAVLAAANPTVPPPGSNNWSCKPSAAHPEPVVLVA